MQGRSQRAARSKEAEKAKLLDEAIAKATHEKQSRITDLEAKLKSKKTTEADQSEADTEPDEGEDDDGNAIVKASRGQKRKAKVQNKMALAQTEKAELNFPKKYWVKNWARSCDLLRLHNSNGI